MLTRNFHTHTQRCRHAEGTDREYVESAIAGGVKVLGFSDHSPYVFEGDYYSTYRMRPEQLADYTGSLLRLKEEYKNDIEIHIGLEAEYYPKYFEAFLKLIEPYPIEYLLLGQHAIKNEHDGLFVGNPKTSMSAVWDYVHQVKEAFSTGAFTYFAHPDLARCAGMETDEVMREIRKAWREICVSAKEYRVPLEINLLGIRTNRHYPNPEFWKIAGEIGNDVVLGADAHMPCDVQDAPSFEIAMNMIREFGLQYRETFELVCPHGRK